jgi:hypothetical protein
MKRRKYEMKTINKQTKNEEKEKFNRICNE